MPSVQNEALWVGADDVRKTASCVNHSHVAQEYALAPFDDVGKPKRVTESAANRMSAT